MAQGNTKGLTAKSGSGGRKVNNITKKGARSIPPKRLERVKQVQAAKKLSSTINKSIEKQMVAAASAGKLSIMKNAGEIEAGAGKGKGKA